MRVSPWRSNAQAEAAWARETLPLGPGFQCSVQMAGYDRNIGAGNETADSRPKPAHLARRATGTLGKEYQDVPFVIQQFRAYRQALRTLHVALERQCVEQDRRGGRSHRVREEVICRRGRKGLVDLAE